MLLITPLEDDEVNVRIDWGEQGMQADNLAHQAMAFAVQKLEEYFDED